MKDLVGRVVCRDQFGGEKWFVINDLGDEIMVVSDEPAYNFPWPEEDYGADDPDDMQAAACLWLAVDEDFVLPEGWSWR